MIRAPDYISSITSPDWTSYKVAKGKVKQNSIGAVGLIMGHCCSYILVTFWSKGQEIIITRNSRLLRILNNPQNWDCWTTFWGGDWRRKISHSQILELRHSFSFSRLFTRWYMIVIEHGKNLSSTYISINP